MHVRLQALRRRPKWVALGVVLALAAGGSATWLLTRSDDTAAASESLVVTVTTGTLRQLVSASGTIAPAQQADLSFSVSGTVTAVTAEVGATVAKGAPLARIDATELQAAVTSAQASVDAAADQLDAQEDAGASATQIASAAAQLATAQTRLTSAKQDLADATLTAPFAGTVAAVDVAVGQQVGTSGSRATSTGTSSSTSSSAQITVITTDAWIVDASVGSSDLAKVKKGLQAEITPTGSATRAFGTVSSVGIVAKSSSSGSATFPVTIAVTGKPTGLYAGGTAAVSIIVKQVQDVLTVPTAAVRSADGKTVVKVRKDGKDTDVAITIGEVYGASTEVKSGLKDGDQVVMTAMRPGGSGQSNRTGRTGTGVPGGGAPAGGSNGGPPPGAGQ